MAWTVKYYYNFKSINNDSYKVDILHDDIVENTEIRASTDPFIVDFPENDLFNPVKSSGAELNLFSTSDRQFLDLYTSDYFKYKVRFYQDSTLIWSGYLDTELYNEPFNSIDNYPVQLTANDGFALLDRLYFYRGSSVTRFTGLLSHWDLLQIILDKLDLDHSYIQVGLSTTSTGVTITTSTTILHGVYVQANNYYNEDNQPETLRTILNDILYQYGASLKKIGDTIYIYDNNTLLSNGTFKRYNSSYTYLSNGSITTNIGDLSSIGFSSTNQQLSIQPAINSQKIKLSKYSTSEVSSFSAGSSDFQLIESLALFGTSSSQYKWIEYYFADSRTINKGGNAKLTIMKGNGTENTNSSAYYVKFDPDTDLYSNLISFKVNPFLYASTNSTDFVYYLKVAMKAYIRTKIYEGDPNEDSYTHLAKGEIHLNVKCDGYQYYMTDDYTGTWILTSDPTYSSKLIYMYDLDLSERIGDQWITNKSPKKDNQTELQDYLLIPLNRGFSDEIEISVINSTYFTAYNGVETNPDAIYDVRIGDLSVTISDAYGNEITDSDIEIIGSLDQLAKNEGVEIKLLSGINDNKYPICRSTLFNNSNTAIQSFVRNVQDKRLEELLLNSIQSNKELPRIKLVSDINTPDNKLGYYTYSNYLSGKNLFPIGEKHNYSENSSQLILLESVEDNLTLI